MKKLITLALLFSLCMPTTTIISAGSTSATPDNPSAIGGIALLLTTALIWRMHNPENPHNITKDEELTWTNFKKDPVHLFIVRCIGHKEIVVKPYVESRGLGYCVELLEKLGAVAMASIKVGLGLRLIDKLLFANINNPSYSLAVTFKTYCEPYLLS